MSDTARNKSNSILFGFGTLLILDSWGGGLLPSSVPIPSLCLRSGYRIRFAGMLSGVYTIQQTSSKCIQNTRANSGRLLNRVNTLLARCSVRH